MQSVLIEGIQGVRFKFAATPGTLDGLATTTKSALSRTSLLQLESRFLKTSCYWL
jgi:hypothetical protein